MLAAMAIAAALCVGIGAYPWPLYALLPFPVDYVPFDATHVVAQLQLLFFSALAFCWLKLSGLYPPELPSVNIDAEWLYRWLGPRAAVAAATASDRLDRAVRARAMRGVGTLIDGLRRHYGPGALPARSWRTSGAAVWVALLLGATLIVYYWQGGG